MQRLALYEKQLTALSSNRLSALHEDWEDWECEAASTHGCSKQAVVVVRHGSTKILNSDYVMHHENVIFIIIALCVVLEYCTQYIALQYVQCTHVSCSTLVSWVWEPDKYRIRFRNLNRNLLNKFYRLQLRFQNQLSNC
jgi:hypothetical protein